MKIKFGIIKSSIALAIFFVTTNALAGTSDGGGGKGVLCGSNLRTLEVYEAEEIYHLPPVTRYPTVEANFKQYGVQLAAYWSQEAVDISDPKVQNEIYEYIHQEVIGRFKDTQGPLGPTSDATLPRLPANCSVVQIAIYSDVDGVIARDRKLWNKLNPFDQTALILHEAYYRAARDLGATTSDATRRLVGLAMHNSFPAPILKPFWGETKRLECSTQDENGHAFQFVGRDETEGGVKGVRLYSIIESGKLSVFRTTAFLDHTSIAQLQSPLHAAWSTQLVNEFVGEPKNLEITIDDSQAQIRTWSPGQTKPAFTQGVCVVTTK
jgi:hypothetical protein